MPSPTDRAIAPRATRERAVPAVTRAVAILRVLAASDVPLGVQAVARALGLVPSTCLHILRALVVEEIVAFDPDTKRYRLDSGLLSLARRMLKQDGFGSRVQPELERLSATYGVTAIGLQVRGLDHVVVVAISRAREPFHIHVDLGSRFPTLISASGRAIAAFGGHDEAELRRRFETVRWDRPPSYAEWRQQIEEARRVGYGVDIDQYILGVSVVSTPIRSAAGIANVLVVVGLTERVRGQIETIGPELVRLAGEIAREADE